MGKKLKQAPKAPPYQVRPGAEYRCFGDGLCCTNIHGLGPLTDDELEAVRSIDEDGAHFDEEFDEPMLCTASDGGCHFLMDDRRCRIHAELGEDSKPEGCRRFPLGLTETPEGGRITTDHRCPCRTLGERPKLEVKDCLAPLSDQGKIWAERNIKKVRLSRKSKAISFADWKRVEAPILQALSDGEPLDAILQSEPFPKLKKSTWAEELQEIADEAVDGSAFGFAALWFVEAARAVQDSTYRARLPLRPWSEAFDRAQARPGTPRSEDAVLADWVADWLWSLKWAEFTDFENARAEIVTRVHVARWIAAHLQSVHGERSDRAAAEAVMVVELLGESQFWTDLMVRMRA